MSNGNTGKENTDGVKEARRGRCSALVVIGFLIGIFAWVIWVGLDYRAMHYVPDFPAHGDKIVISPRLNAALGAIFYAEIVAILGLLLVIGGIVTGRRSLKCFFACFPSILFIVFPFAAVRFNDF